LVHSQPQSPRSNSDIRRGLRHIASDGIRINVIPLTLSG